MLVVVISGISGFWEQCCSRMVGTPALENVGSSSTAHRIRSKSGLPQVISTENTQQLIHFAGYTIISYSITGFQEIIYLLNT